MDDERAAKARKTSAFQTAPVSASSSTVHVQCSESLAETALSETHLGANTIEITKVTTAVEDEDIQVTEELSAEWLKEERKRKRGVEKKAKKNYPAFALNLNAYRETIGIKDIRGLMSYILGIGGHAQKWLMIKNQGFIRRFVLLQIPCLHPDLFYDSSKPLGPIEILPSDNPSNPTYLAKHVLCLQDIFRFACPIRNPGDKNRINDFLQALIRVPLSNSELAKRKKKQKNDDELLEKRPLESYSLSLADLLTNNYPIPIALDADSILPEDYVETRAGDINAVDGNKKRVLGMDCEMCETSAGLELTRVTLVDSEGKIIYDELVKPEREIINYLTKFSGITAGHLTTVTKSLKEVQQDLLSIIDHNVILVGHSLECDLKAVKMAHPFIIDTAVIYHQLRGPPYKPSLKWLTRKHLERDIQSGGDEGDRVGHCSAEDAIACIDLLKKKVENGPNFGLSISEFDTVFNRLRSLAHPRRSALIDSPGPIKKINESEQAEMVVKCANDDEVVAGILSAVELDHSLVIARLRGLETLYQGVEAQDIKSLTAGPSESSMVVALQNLDQNLKRIWDALPPCTAFVIVGSPQDGREVARLARRKTSSFSLYRTQNERNKIETEKDDTEGNSREDDDDKEKGIKEGEPAWTGADEIMLETAVEKAKRGVAFFTVK